MSLQNQANFFSGNPTYNNKNIKVSNIKGRKTMFLSTPNIGGVL